MKLPKERDMNIKNALIAGFFMTLHFSLSGQDAGAERIKAEVWNTVKTINRLWTTTEDLDSLGLFIHPDMIIIFPGMKEMVGEEEVMGMYRTFTDLAETLSFQESTPVIQLFNNNTTAVVTYTYDLEIKLEDGAIRQATGRDLYTLVKESGRWVAVGQHYSRYQRN